MAKKKVEDKTTTIAKNRKALHDYDIIETFEAGIALSGTEVKSLRENHCQLVECFAIIRRGECWLIGVHIAPYKNGSYSNVDPDRNRKLLLHKKQIRYLLGKTKEQGMSLVPIRIYFAENGLVKVELALAKGRKAYDKRDAMAKRDSQRDIERAMKSRNRY